MLACKSKRWKSCATAEQMASGNGWNATMENGVDGILYAEVVLGSYSHKLLHEINPLNPSGILGSIGGFWGKHLALRRDRFS